ncbi:MAG TPA: NAD(P)H-hydrate epimerase [Anaerolineae bacterium]|jgi:ADP-dependent NAD(P)H-hydrate dehydratase / NAD(P)H-hydrate epimerase|nr:NAD(P)H-hydrate epimerase [Anaerolineae bacterium]
MTITQDPTTGLLLPVSDAFLFGADVDVDALTERWRRQAALDPMTGEEMRGTDARAQRLGTAGEWLMEQAGTATAAAARALMVSADRSLGALVLILCGPGNNGGDGLVAARRLAEQGIASEVVLLSSSGLPDTPDATRNWERLDDVARINRVATARDSDMALYLSGIERAALVIDALLGTGVRGPLREPIRTAVDVAVRARESQVPVLAVDTPTAVDLSTGELSDPVVRADVTVTFHRPKEGHRARVAKVLAGRVLVAPIGIPLQADRG